MARTLSQSLVKSTAKFWPDIGGKDHRFTRYPTGAWSIERRNFTDPTQRIHGITTKGGDAPNIIPAHTSAKYIIRGQTLEELEELRSKVQRCFEAGAIATGATWEVVGGDKPYAEMIHDVEMAAVYRRNAEALGRAFPDLGVLPERAAGSTNVSMALPAIHPFIGINSLPAVNHQPEFAAHCIKEEADQALHDGALAMAWTAIDIARDDDLRNRLIARR